jgi:phospholipid transport system substrate-binding protein
MKMCWSLMASIGLLCFAASANGGTDTPTAAVKVVLDAAMDIQTREDLQGPEKRNERFKLTHQIIEENFLSAEMAMDSLKDHWKDLSKGQREEFQSLFIDLFQDSYTRMVLNYLRKESIEYLGEQKEQSRVRVQTKIMRANEHIPVDYFLIQKSGRWSILDVEIDEVSIVRNYQNSFHRVILAESFEGLMKKMRVQSQAVKEEPSS